MTLEPLIAAAVVGLLGLAIVVTVLIVRRTVDVRPRPQQTVQSYLHAIASGDASTANALFSAASVDRDALPTAADRSGFMSDAALGAAIERISDATIGRVTRATGSDAAVVYVSFSLAGERFTDLPLVLAWREGMWRLTTGLWRLLQVRPVFTGESSHPAKLTVRLGDALPDRPDLAVDGSFLAYPGVYPLTVSADGWVTEPGSTVVDFVVLAGPGAVVVRPRFVAA